MPEQTIKHDNAIPGFLLILVPMAFLAVFLSVAWPFIMGATLLITGNSVWQSYQLAKLSQQVNPFFNQLIVEKQGEISSLDLSVRANISGPLANRYLYSKAVKFGGTSHRSESQGVVYNFLTVNSLENVFTGINPNPTATEKLAGLDESPAVSLFQTLSTAVIETPATEISEPIAEHSKDLPAPETAIIEATAIIEPPSVRSAPVTPETPTLVTESPAISPPEIPRGPKMPPAAVAPPVVETASSFTQALRNIFNAESSAEEDVHLEPTAVSEVSQETISQADLAKRLDVHASTIYKRRSDISFDEWTRSRDPEGIAWGYSRETKEFYRIG